jgi:hypothetical protein
MTYVTSFYDKCNVDKLDDFSRIRTGPNATKKVGFIWFRHALLYVLQP